MGNLRCAKVGPNEHVRGLIPATSCARLWLASPSHASIVGVPTPSLSYSYASLSFSPPAYLAIPRRHEILVPRDSSENFPGNVRHRCHAIGSAEDNEPGMNYSFSFSFPFLPS